MDNISPALYIERLIDRYRAELIVPPNDQTRHLSETYLASQFEDLTADLYVLRARVDAFYQEQQGRLTRGKGRKLSALEKQNLAAYPKGYCLEITRRLLRELNKEIRLGALKSIPLLQDFCRGGGRINRIWGGLRGIYFQNAIQAGSYYIDVANDTVDVTKPKIEILPIEDVDYQQFDSYFDYAKVAEIYWKCRMLPNSYFPNLAPYFPIIVFHADGRIGLESPSSFMFPMNLSKNFAPAHQYIFNTARWEEADRECHARLMCLMASHVNRDEKTLLFYTPDRDEARLASSFTAAQAQSPAVLARTIKQVLDVNCHLGKVELSAT